MALSANNPPSSGRSLRRAIRISLAGRCRPAIRAYLFGERHHENAALRRRQRRDGHYTFAHSADAMADNVASGHGGSYK